MAKTYETHKQTHTYTHGLKAKIGGVSRCSNSQIKLKMVSVVSSKKTEAGGQRV